MSMSLFLWSILAGLLSTVAANYVQISLTWLISYQKKAQAKKRREKKRAYGVGISTDVRTGLPTATRSQEEKEAWSAWLQSKMEW